MTRSSLSNLVRRAVLATLVTLTASSAFSAENVIYQFQGGVDGQDPLGSLVADGEGNLYGTTYGGGVHNWGTVFKLTPQGIKTVLYSFQGGNDAASPLGLVMDSAGNLYGTSQYNGSSNLGTVFKVTPDGTESVLYSFQGGTDGALPDGTLMVDRNGNLYGTTQDGGNPNCYVFSPGTGCGTVFEIPANGSERILYSFNFDTDGAIPYGGVIADAAGNLYGTTGYGGNYSANCSNTGCGTVFELQSDGQEKILYAFQGGNDGSRPFAGLVADSSGDLFGATASGGAQDFGTVFKLAPDGTETVLRAFQKSDGWQPQRNLVLDDNNNLYGMTTYGGNDHCFRRWGCGVVFKIAPDGKETVLDILGAKRGVNPSGSPLIGGHGLVYGTASGQGACKQCGLIFSVNE